MQDAARRGSCDGTHAAGVGRVEEKHAETHAGKRDDQKTNTSNRTTATAAAAAKAAATATAAATAGYASW